MARSTTPLGADYRRLMASSIVSNLGDGVSMIAYPWLASAVTRNPLHIAAVGVATRLPWLIVTLPAGVVTDRVDRRILVAAMDGIRFVVTFAFVVLVWSERTSLVDPATAAPATTNMVLLVALYGAAIALGTAEVLRDNGAQTLMPAIVDDDQLERANGRLWSAESLMNQFVGPPLAGFLLGISFVLPFALDAVSFGLAAVIVYSLKGDFAPGNRGGSAPVASDVPAASWRADVLEGLRWLWGHRLLRVMALILGGLNLAYTVQLATLVLFAQEVLGLSSAGFGQMMAITAVGGLVGGIAASRVARVIGQGPSLFLTLGVSGLTSVIMGLSSEALVVGAMMAVDGFLAMLWNVITVAFRQSIIPDRLLGRVNSVYRLFAWGAIPIGGVIGGLIVAVADALGDRELALRLPFFFTAASCLALLALGLPRLGTDKLEAARAEAAGPDPGASQPTP